MGDFKAAVEAIIGTPAAGFEWQPSRMYMLHGEVTCAFKSVPLWVPLWVPPKGVFLRGWLTRNEGDNVFWWSAEVDEYDRSQESWISYGLSMLLAGIHPDNLPPIEIPAHLSKFRVGDD